MKARRVAGRNGKQGLHAVSTAVHHHEMVNPADRVILLGRTTWRNQGRPFGIRQADRLQHVYIIGRTGVGKSTLLRSMCLQDAKLGNGFALLDPHGDLVEAVRNELAEERRGDLIDFDVPARWRTLGFNPLASVPPERRTLAASGMLEVFAKLWPASWGPRSEHLLRNTFLALLEQPDPSLADGLRLFDDARYRKRAAGRVSNPQVRRFWLEEFEGYGARLRAEAVAPLQNKIGAFLADPVLREILTRPRSDLDLREVMDGGKILLVNLAKGKLGEDSASLLGSLLVSRIGLAALSRADVRGPERRDFFVYLDEFPTFTTLSLAGMLSELRKYHVGLTLAHQYLEQVDERVREAILANAGTLIAFRVGAEDAEALEVEFGPEILSRDLVNLPNRQNYVLLLDGGRAQRAFSAETVRLLA